MASIRREIAVAASPDDAWAAVRDVGAVHERLAPGFVTNVELEDDARVVTFGNGAVVRELIVDVDDERRRLAYAAVGGQSKHHHATIEVVPDGHGSMLIWTTDVLPDEVAPGIATLMDAAAPVIRRTLTG